MHTSAGASATTAGTDLEDLQAAGCCWSSSCTVCSVSVAAAPFQLPLALQATPLLLLLLSWHVTSELGKSKLLWLAVVPSDRCALSSRCTRCMVSCTPACLHSSCSCSRAARLQKRCRTTLACHVQKACAATAQKYTRMCGVRGDGRRHETVFTALHCNAAYARLSKLHQMAFLHDIRIRICSGGCSPS